MELELITEDDIRWKEYKKSANKYLKCFFDNHAERILKERGREFEELGRVFEERYPMNARDRVLFSKAKALQE